MRLNEQSQECPATLGEYRELLERMAEEAGLVPAQTRAIEFIDAQIADVGVDHLVQAPDFQIRQLLYPMIKQPREHPLPSPDDETNSNPDPDDTADKGTEQ